VLIEDMMNKKISQIFDENKALKAKNHSTIPSVQEGEQTKPAADTCCEPQ